MPEMNSGANPSMTRRADSLLAQAPVPREESRGALFLGNKKAERSRTRTLGPFWKMCLLLSTLLLLFRSRSRRSRWRLLGGLLRRRSRRGRRSLFRGRSGGRCRGCGLLLLCLLLATDNGEHEGHHEAKNKRCHLFHYRHLLSSHFYPKRVSLPFHREELQVGGPT
jgi:hypothetical protein